MTHSDLVKMAEKWLYRKGCGIVFTEFHTKGTSEIPDAIGFRDQGKHTILVECKTNRKDLSKDKRKPFRKRPTEGVGNNRYYLCPPGVITPRDLPRKWGLLYAYPSGIVRVIVGPKITEDSTFIFENVNNNAESSILFTALRRLYLRGDLSKVYDSSQVSCVDGNCQSKFKFTK